MKVVLNKLPEPPVRLATVAALLVSLLQPGALGAQAQAASAGPAPVGTVIVAHGGGPEWNAQVETVARQVRTGGPVAVSFLMGPGAATARFQDVVAALARQGVREVVVVPMLVSSHSGHYEQVRWLVGQTDSLDAVMRHHLHMSGIERPAGGVALRLARAVDDAPEAAVVVADRARALAMAPAEEALFIVGHGPNSAEDHAAWMTNLRTVADRVREATGFRSVLVGLVRDDAPDAVRAEAVRGIREQILLQREATGRDVVVVPVLVATGQVSRVKIAKDLAGLPIRYTGEALLPHPAMARWVESRVRAAAGGEGGPVSAD
jgi:sirohydrochlorin ferrochelatase